MPVLDSLLGEPLASSEEKNEKLGPAAAIPVFGLDALGSAAYGPEAALTILIPVGVVGIQSIVPISLSIIGLLIIVCISYLQTIPAYPNGGGSYTVASRNLGRSWGLLAGTALMIDYVLTVAVGISSGVGALLSALPAFQSHSLALCLAILVLITVINLRGVRESGIAFMIPTYLYVFCMFATLGIGAWKTIASAGHPVPLVQPHHLNAASQAATAWLLLKAFSSGCTAMTGVEAVSNGVAAFRDPRTRTARQTLVALVAILVLMLIGIAVLSRAYGIGATPPGQSGYESVLSQLTGAIVGKGVFYYVTICSILLVLALQANTAFAGFPRLCRAIAEDGYLPRSFVNRGRRLVYTYGIVILAILTAALLIVFEGVTDRLIPLFAVGAFLAFTLSQAGMVVHWRKAGGAHAIKSSLLNAFGAALTVATLAIVVISKFTDGAWITILLVPGILAVMYAIKRHDRHVERELASPAPLPVNSLCAPVVVVPIDGWDRVSQRAIRFGLSISREVLVVHVRTEQDSNELEQHWEEWVTAPARKAGIDPPQLLVLSSPYRFVIQPIMEFVLNFERAHPDRHLAVIVPQLVQSRWLERFLHNQRGSLLTALLLLHGNKRISIVNVPWYLRDAPA